MSGKIEFETPENVPVTFHPAGLGTRFLAWLVDRIILGFALFVIFVLLACLGVITDTAFRELEESMRGAGGEIDPTRTPEALMYFLGIILLIQGFAGFLYYGCCEFLMRGQTPGKRLVGIRVVRLDGFGLDAGGIFIRNVFRLIDHLPPLWIVPVVSTKAQRLGDMVAGTAVIADRKETISDLRQELARQPAAEARFTFDNARLKRLRPQDVEALERILERWNELTPARRAALLDQLVPPLVARLQVDAPPEADRLRFLTDLLAAEFRRQHRSLG